MELISRNIGLLLSDNDELMSFLGLEGMGPWGRICKIYKLPSPGRTKLYVHN